MTAHTHVERPNAKPDSSKRAESKRAESTHTDSKSAQSRGAGSKRNGAAADRKGLASIDDAVKSFLRASGIGAKLGPWPVYQAFLEAAGASFARRARPVRFARGELVVEVDSAAHLAELQSFLGAELRSKTNQILGAENVRKLTFKLKR